MELSKIKKFHLKKVLGDFDERSKSEKQIANMRVEHEIFQGTIERCLTRRLGSRLTSLVRDL